MDPKEFFAKAAEQAGSCVKLATPDRLGNTTPCSEWDLRALLNHMISELLWLPELLRGKTLAEVGIRYDGDIGGSNPASNWERAADAALVAVHRADKDAIVHLSYGDFPTQHYIAEIASNVLIHGWDVGQSLQCSLILYPDAAHAAYDQLAPNIKGYRDRGLVGKPIEVGEDASIQARLLALMGRRQ
jgi:uncharacterized protein (TIGR03086 family)